MNDVAAYHVSVCALFPVQGGIPPCTGNHSNRS